MQIDFNYRSFLLYNLLYKTLIVSGDGTDIVL